MTKPTSPPVVVGVDGSTESLAAVRLAATAAALRDVPLRMVHARGGSPAADTGDAPEGPTAMAVAHRAALASRPGLDVTTAVVDASPAGVLLDEAETAALLVIGARGTGGVSRMLLGSVALDLVTRAQRPVMLARGEEPAADAPILVGVSGAPTGRNAVGFAFAEAEARAVPLHAVHAFNYPYTTDESQVTDRDRHRAGRLLANWVDEWRDKYPGVAVRLSAVHAVDPVAALIGYSGSAGLLVLGARQRGKLRARLLGSTGYTLMRTSRCPLAIIHKEPQPVAAHHFGSAFAHRSGG